MEKQTYRPSHLLNRFFVLAWIIAFTLQMGQILYNYTITLFANSLGMSNTLAGLISIPYLVLAIVGRIVGGMVCDKYGRRYGMILGAIGFLIGSVFYCLPVGELFPVIFICRGLHGFGYACCSTSYSVVVVDVTPKDQSAIGIGINWTAQGIAQAVGGVMLAFLIVGDQFLPVFLSASIFLFVAVLSCVVCRYEHGRPEPAEADCKESLLSQMVEKRAIPDALIVLINYCGVCLISFYAASYAREAGILGFGFFYTASAVTMVITNVALPKLETKFGTIAVLIPVFVLSAAGVINLAYASSLFTFMLSGLGYGIAIGSVPIFQNNTVKGLPWNRRGAGTSTLFLAMDLAMGVGPVFWGVVLDHLGYTFAAYAAGALFAVAAVMSVYTYRTKK